MAYEIIIFFMDWNYLLYYIYLDNCVQGLGKRKEGGEVGGFHPAKGPGFPPLLSFCSSLSAVGFLVAGLESDQK